MDDAHNEKLRFDIRLARRIGWLSPEELAQELASLPDVSDKVHQPAEDERSDTSGPGEAPGA